MSNIVERAIKSVQKARASFCKFISANDAGKTGGHQSGFYIPKSSISLFTDTPGVKGSNDEKFIRINWQDGSVYTDSRFIYYGTGTRNEYRLTNFGRGFPFLQDDSVGDLLILSHIEQDQYEAFVLNSDDEFEEFFMAVNITVNDTNKLIPKVEIIDAEDSLLKCFQAYTITLNKQFPTTGNLAKNARDCYNNCYKITKNQVTGDPDNSILKWLNAEFQLFKAIEADVHAERIKFPFKNIEDLVIFANSLLNTRKARAGKSLELHLAEIFKTFEMRFTAQAKTEDQKTPDFIFPTERDYKDTNFESKRLVFLASKTTCKDRWRQVINEADRIKTKHLFTLQQGISANQLKEMTKEGVKLVVPEPYLKTFPKEYRPEIFTLDNFIKFTIATTS